VADKQWNPWRELRSRTHIVFRLNDIADVAGGAVYYRRGDRAAIVISPSLPRPDRAAALAHELVHDERGGADHEGMPPCWGPVVKRDEARVDREVARRLIDLEELAEYVEGRASIGEPVFARDVAEWFDVAEWVAQRALELLQQQEVG
jgi:hypothetical protein